MRGWTVQAVNAALPELRAVIQRIRDLALAAASQQEEAAERAHGNGQRGRSQAAAELDAAVEELAARGIVLRDLASGLVDFPAVSSGGREYLLCWLVDEPEVAWWHWPDTGFAGRRPLDDPPD